MWCDFQRVAKLSNNFWWIINPRSNITYDNRIVCWRHFSWWRKKKSIMARQKRKKIKFPNSILYQTELFGHFSKSNFIKNDQKYFIIFVYFYFPVVPFEATRCEDILRDVREDLCTHMFWGLTKSFLFLCNLI